jgi:phosphoglycerate dehydrogenase-like enzyme
MEPFETQPLIYVALSPQLSNDLALDKQLERVAALARIEYWNGEGSPTLDAMSDALRRAPIVLTGWQVPPLQAILADWTPDTGTVRLIVHTAGTVKYFLPAQAVARGLIVTHANDALAEAVAEFTIGVIITARRQVIPSAARMKAGQWRMPLTRQHELWGSTVGIIGASNIGRRVMRLLQPFDVTLLLYDPYCAEATAAHYGATLVSLDELMRRSDIVSLHAPVTAETIGMLGAAQFAAMKDGALFVNTARGRLVDHEALLRELQQGRIDAVLDVTDPTEPLPLDSPFFQLENCIVLPHLAAITVETRHRQARYAVDEVLRYLRGEPLRYQVTPERWETMA